MSLFQLSPTVSWFLLGFIFILFELLFFSVFTLFFGIGAWVVCLVLFITPLSQNAAVVIFIISSLLSLIIFRKKIVNSFKAKKSNKGEYTDILSKDFIDQEVDVIEEIGINKPGRVLLHGVSWQASAHENIPAGSRVRVVKQDNLMLSVIKLN